MKAPQLLLANLLLLAGTVFFSANCQQGVPRPITGLKEISRPQAEQIVLKHHGLTNLLPFCEQLTYNEKAQSLGCFHNGKWGIISTTGYLTVKPECQSISALSNLYLCEFNNKTTLLSNQGEHLYSLENGRFYQGLGFGKNVIISESPNGIGLLLASGEVVLEPDHSSFDCAAFYTGRYTHDDKVCQVTKNGKYGLVRTTGQKIFAAECDEVAIGGLINNWCYKCIKGETAYYYNHKAQLVYTGPKDDNLAGNFRRRHLR